jgi:predicted MPP superfamily phosphohydrolase
MIKKIILVLTLISLVLLLIFSKPYEIIYTDDLPILLEVESDQLKILQITDLHLAYGIDHRDRRTYKLIEAMAKSEDFDLIVVTGDITMSPHAPMLFRNFIRFMESLKTPWTFIFGNHETDFHTYGHFLKQIRNTEYLHFKVGPKIEDGGVGNFHIEFQNQGHTIYKAYFLDSKAERKDFTEEEGEYDYLSVAQVSWYESHASLDTVESIVFMHMPLRQYILVGDDYVGFFKEKKVYAQGVDTGFFDAMLLHQKSKAVFVGHDHKNDFYFFIQGIMLAYGRATGFNAYGILERGGRVIEISNANQITTRIVVESEVR